MNVGLIAAHHLGHSLASVIHGEASELMLDRVGADLKDMVARIMRTLRFNRLEYPSGPVALWFIDRALSFASWQRVVPRPIERLLSLHQLDEASRRRMHAPPLHRLGA